jgi:EAL domain-containing protein (putative c-di-GMP-specific phosphodiesterase class I)/GGDEF domain-containing protein
MSLIRQIWLLLFTVLALAVGGAVIVNLVSARDSLQAQVNLKNADNAQTLALALSQQRADRGLMELLVAAQADTGHYQLIRFTPVGGGPAFERRFEVPAGPAPGWFRALLPIVSTPGVALVSDGWRELGRVEVVTQVEHVTTSLWTGGWRAVLWMALVGTAAALVAVGGVRRLRAPIDATVAQARSLSEGRFVSVAEPAQPELREMAKAMNTMVGRVREVYAVQAGEAETWRQRAHGDGLTGLPHRSHFFDRLATLRQREDGAAGGCLVLIRLADLDGLNRRLGRPTTDLALCSLAELLRAYTERVTDSLAGRLNGADFALFLPGAALAPATAGALAEGLRTALSAHGAEVLAHLGAVSLPPGASLPMALAQADLALARAEMGPPFVLGSPMVGTAEHIPASPPHDAPPLGERDWRMQLQAAVATGQATLVEYPVLDASGALSHLECPLRLPLAPGGAPQTAATWLPLAVRSRLTASIDLEAARLALAAIARDGRPRGVNFATATLADAGFAPQLRELLLAEPDAAQRLWVEVTERAALDRFRPLQELARQLRPLGVRVGLEHAGPQLQQITRLYELGLDFIKLDASVCTGIHSSASGQEFVRSTVRLLLPLRMAVLAEGIDSADDAAALWAIGVTAITGPWATAQPR